MDRFSMKISMGYPTNSEESEILDRNENDNPTVMSDGIMSGVICTRLNVPFTDFAIAAASWVYLSSSRGSDGPLFHEDKHGLSHRFGGI